MPDSERETQADVTAAYTVVVSDLEPLFKLARSSRHFDLANSHRHEANRQAV
jgi:hypothetical protein